MFQLRTVLMVSSFESTQALVNFVRPMPLSISRYMSLPMTRKRSGAQRCGSSFAMASFCAIVERNATCKVFSASFALRNGLDLTTAWSSSCERENDRGTGNRMGFRSHRRSFRGVLQDLSRGGEDYVSTLDVRLDVAAAGIGEDAREIGHGEAVVAADINGSEKGCVFHDCFSIA